ncbi:MAG TPA: uracil-DNA glycosylase [Rhodopila sp.]|nr:uracil-DNA glycosylase [Rhodopila sp.]
MDDAYALLRLQVEWGADEALDLDPIDRLRAPEPRPAERPAAARAHAATPHPLAATSHAPVALRPAPAEQAIALAGQARTLPALREALAGFDGCALRDTATNLVFAEGDPSSPTLIIGDPPGRDDDRSGHPFAGPESQLLDQMLASIGLTRSQLMLAPMLPWRPPGGRPPSPAEIALCLPFLHRLVALLKPRHLLLMGSAPARALSPPSANRRRFPRGWSELNIPGMQQSQPFLVLPGLGEMLKNPPLRRDAWAGLRLLRRALDQTPT